MSYNKYRHSIRVNVLLTIQFPKKKPPTNRISLKIYINMGSPLPKKKWRHFFPIENTGGASFVFSATFRHVRLYPTGPKRVDAGNLPGRFFVEKTPRKKQRKRGTDAFFGNRPCQTPKFRSPMFVGQLNCPISLLGYWLVAWWNVKSFDMIGIHNHDQICQQITICYPHLKPFLFLFMKSAQVVAKDPVFQNGAQLFNKNPAP